jgi:predicted transglutaminase-like cysteine proteinase
MRTIFPVLLVLLIIFVSVEIGGAGSGIFDFDQALLDRVKEKYGQAAVVRLQNLAKLVTMQATGTEMDKVEHVNDFFNKVTYYRDIVHWKKKDYWATPFEKLSTNGGDCEDYAIAKYFTLREIGVDDQKLRIMYVKAIALGEAHMVLAYFPAADDLPLVLDNINVEILPANKRKDLIPIYSFNAESLWLAKSRGTGKKVGSSGKLKLWTDLQERVKRL